MERYIAFLRGVNVGGKNKVPMAQLKEDFKSLEFVDVNTYLNSGNIIFSSCEKEKQILVNQIEQMIREKYDLDIPIFVITKIELEDVLFHAPSWWGSDDKDLYDNLIFIMTPATFNKIYEELGVPKDGLEKIFNYKNTVFWTFSRKDYQKTNWWKKTASVKISCNLTIRTAGTVRKICQL